MFARMQRIAPRRGWRAFIGEVGIIVLGVLVAVGIGKVVDALDWRGRVADARAVLDNEIRDDNFFDISERRLVTPCLLQQLNRLHAIAIDTTGRVPRAVARTGLAEKKVYVFPSRSWTTTSWDAAVADGIPAHMNLGDRLFYGRHYLWMRKIGVLNDASDSETSDLSLLSEPLALDLSTRAHLLNVIAREQTRVASINVIIAQRIKELEDTGRDMKLPRALLDDMNTLKWCRANGLL